MKENDWILAGLKSPENNTNDFIFEGLTVDNTQLLTPEVYKKSPLIKEKFSENGTFNEKAFDEYYNQRAVQFRLLYESNVNDTFMYDPFDPRSVKKPNIKSPKFNVVQVANTDRDRTLLSGTVLKDNLSRRERAQQNKIFDVETNTWKEETPNDSALTNSPIKWLTSIFSDPLVYAKYEEDGEHYDPFTGKMVKHSKGEDKINQYGLPYTETLGGRSLVGKEVVSKFDLLTVDGEGVNSIDFFDSDGKEKSVTGTILKGAAAIAPLFTPFGWAYSGLMVGRELLKTLPMLYGMASSWSDEHENATLNTLAGIAQGLTGGTSDAGKASMLNSEQAVNLITDVALLWGQQRAIASGIQKLRGVKQMMNEAKLKAFQGYEVTRAQLEALKAAGQITEKAFKDLVGDNIDDWATSGIGESALKYFNNKIEPMLKASNRLGADMSLAYMALVSNTDVYQSMLEAGASRKEAAAVTLGSTLGMFGVDKYLHLGEVFFDDLTTETEHQIRRTLKKGADKWALNVFQNTEDKSTKSLIKRGIDLGKKAVGDFSESLKYHTTGFFGKAVGEGLEEVTEELVSDVSKSLYELAGSFGFDTTVKDVGAWDNMLARYSMSFLGGALGGGLFYGVDVYQNGKFSIDETQDEMIYLIRNGKAKEAHKKLDELRDKGKLGSTSLSTTRTKGADGKETFVTADKNHQSQNDFIYNRLNEALYQLENILTENGVTLNDDDLFNTMVLNNLRFKELKKYLNGTAYETKYYEDYQTAVNKVVNLEGELAKAALTTSGNANDADKTQNINGTIVPVNTDAKERHLNEVQEQRRTNNLKRIQEALKEAKEHLNNFISGKYSAEYVEKMLFALDDNLNQGFTHNTFDSWLMEKYGVTQLELSTTDALSYKQEYLNYKRSEQSLDLDAKFKIYKQIKKLADPLISEIKDNEGKYREFRDKISEAFQDLSEMQMYSEDDLFEGETKESESWLNRRDGSLESIDRSNRIDKHNQEVLNARRDLILKAIDDSGGYIDPLTRRYLTLMVKSRNKDLINSHIDMAIADNLDPESDIALTFSEMLKSDGYDNPEIMTRISELLKRHYENTIENQRTLSNNLAAYVEDAFEMPWDDNTFYFFKSIYDEGDDFDSQVKDVLLEIRDSYPDITDSLIASLIEQFRLGYEHVRDFLKDVENLETEEERKLAIQNGKDRMNQESLIPLLAIVEKGNIEENQSYLDDLQQYRETIDTIKKNIGNNPMIQLNNELNSKISDINPVTDLVKKLSLQLNVNHGNIEKILDKLNARYQQLDSILEFILSTEEEESLDEAEYLLKLTLSYVNAASSEPNFFSPFGHNGLINSFAKTNPDAFTDFKELPVLDAEVAGMYYTVLNNYLSEIGTVDQSSGSYNMLSWRWLSNNNKINKAEQYIKAEKAWNFAYYSLFRKLYDLKALIIKEDDNEINLLEGFDEIPVCNQDSKDIDLYNYKISKLLYNNILKLLSKGITYDQLWEKLGIFDINDDSYKLWNPKEIVKLLTSSLDLNTSLKTLTDYDKMIILLTTMSQDPTKYYSYLNDRITSENQIAPLTIQEWVSRVGMAYINNPEIFHSAFDYVLKKSGSKKPILFGCYVNGNGGAGKSRVCAKNIVLSYNTLDVWLSCPEETQVNTLFDSIGIGTKMLNNKELNSGKSLFERMGLNMSEYSKFMADVNSNNESSSYYSKVVEKGMNIIVPDYDKLGITQLDGAPKILVIDEVTHLSQPQLRIISKWAELNNVRLLFLGDDKLLGFQGFCANIDSESSFMLRTPVLGLSLRDNNALHQENLNTLSRLIKDYLAIDDSDPKKQVIEQAIKTRISSLKFKIYDTDDINGDLLTQSLSEELISKLNGTVGFVGDSNSRTLQLLLQHIPQEKLTILNPKEVQGLEFDYVIVDKQFDTAMRHPADMLHFLLDLYTMISRGKKGSILIDSGHMLELTIGKNVHESVKAVAENILLYVELFRQDKLKSIAKILSGNENQALQTTDTNPPSDTNPSSAGTSGATGGTNEQVKTLNVKPPKKYEELLKEFDDITSEINEDEQGFAFENSDGSPILCYGNMTLSGFQVDKSSGREVWLNPKSDEIRDGQMFTDKEVIDADNEQWALSYQLRTLKNYILYDDDFSTAPPFITSIISEEAYKNILWLIEVRDQTDRDNFLRTVGVDGVKLINGKMYTVVGKIKLRNGKTATLTLGLLADPNTYRDNTKHIRDNFKKKLDKTKAEKQAAVGKSAEYIKTLDDKIKYYELKLKDTDPNDVDGCALARYEKLLKDMAEVVQKNGKPIDIPRPITPGMTDLHRVRRAIRLSRKKAAIIKNLNKRIAILELQRDEYDQEYHEEFNQAIDYLRTQIEQYQSINESSFHSLNSGDITKVSPMYIYTPSSLTSYIEGIDMSVVGRANVIFVTNSPDPNLTPENLVHKYIEQKQHAAIERQLKGFVPLLESESKPKIRMIVLKNLGVSIQDLCDPYLQDSMYSESIIEKDGEKKIIKQIFPFNEDYTGARMYVSMWNFRANLLQFERELKNFISTLPIDRSELDTYLLVKNILWKQSNGKTLSRQETEYLSLHNNLPNFDTVSSAVDKFNDDLCNKVKEFRLGGNLKNGAFIRNLTGNKLGSLYDTSKKTPSGIYLNIATFDTYLNLIESIFTNILDQVVGCNYKHDRPITADDGYSNSLSGLYSKVLSGDGILSFNDSNNPEDFEDDGDLLREVNLHFTNQYRHDKGNIGNAFAHIPAIMMKTFKYTCMRQSHYNDNFDINDRYSIKITDKLPDGTRMDKHIEYYRIWKYIDSIENSQLHSKEDLDSMTFDPTLSNMLSFMYHGTLEDVNSEDALRASDALFPNGFYSDPLADLSEKPIEISAGNAVFKKALQQTIFFGSDVLVNDPTFFVTLQTMRKAVDDAKNPQPPSNHRQEALDMAAGFKTQLPWIDLTDFEERIDLIDPGEEIQALLTEVLNQISKTVSDNQELLFSKNGANIDINMPFLQSNDDQYSVISLLDVIKSNYNGTLPDSGIYQIDKSNGDVRVIAPNGVVLTLKLNKDNKLVIEDTLKPKVNDVTIALTVELFLKDSEKQLSDGDYKYIKQRSDALNNPKLHDKAFAQLVEKLLKIGKNPKTSLELLQRIQKLINDINDLNCKG